MTEEHDNSADGSCLKWSTRQHGPVRPMTVALLLCCLSCPVVATHAKATPPPPSKSAMAQQQFAHAATMRQDLEGRAQGTRTKLDYGRVLDAYRAVYHGDPASDKAPEAVTAVAELLAEEGRLFAERKPLEDAVGQYEFLRKQYPATPLRLKGSLVEAEILGSDLGDRDAARARLQEFLKNYPRSELAPQARRGLASLDSAPMQRQPAVPRVGAPQIANAPATAAIEPVRAKSVTNPGPVKNQGTVTNPTTVTNQSGAHRAALSPRDSAAITDAGEPASAAATPLPEPGPEWQARAVYAAGKEPPAAVLTNVSEQETPPARKSGRVMVTDIRHWSTPNYTRVAIDLGGEVRFQAGRVPNPDRIYFDLYNTRLAPQLMGHLISVDGDAFLKDIRAAQYTQEVTRVVLDVGSLSEYSAFLLPNPYRLIIDVHGRKPGSPAEAHKASAPTEGPGVDSDVAPTGAAVAPGLTKPASPKPAATNPAAANPAATTVPAKSGRKSKPEPLPETVLAPVDKPAKPKPADKKADDKKTTDKSAEPAANADAPAANPAATTGPATGGSAARSAGDVDANGHETGVANPPGDVSTTPDDTPATPPAATPPVAPPPAPSPGSGGDEPSSQQNLVSRNMSRSVPRDVPQDMTRANAAAKTPAPTKGAPLQQDSANEVATLQQQPRIVRAKKQPTTQPVVDTVAPRKEDATDALPFARSVVPGAVPQSAASTDWALEKNALANTAAAESTANSLNTPPIPNKHKRGKKSPATPGSSTQVDPQLLQVHEAEPTASGERSLVRALGLKIGRIVIDPGHGGHDAGTVGPDGLAEKDVVLDVGLRLGKLLRQRLGADVTFTRSTDVFVPLETRTAIANKAQADLFVSIHANSSSDPSARGVETYYLNFTSSPDALDVAARENAVSQKSIHELQDLVKKITLKDKIEESKEFAGDVDRSLSQGMGQTGAARDRGVKKAPFVVLIGANMPSILTEISFVSNPEDAHDLRDPAYRERLAESLYTGIARYINGLSSVRVAQTTPHGVAN